MRKKTWKTDFVDYVHSNVATPFYFGKHDCCLTACDMILEITGVDLAKSFRGTYGGASEMFKVLEKHNGVEAIAEKACKEHNWEPIPPKFASKGDLVMVDAGAGRNALGVVDLCGSKIICAAPIGFTRKPLSSALKAWRIK